MRTRLALAPLLGLTLSLAFEPVAAFWLLPLAMGGYLWCLRERTAREGALLGLLFGGAFMFSNIIWMRAVADAAWIGLAGVETLFLALGGALLAVVSRWRWWPVWTAAVWVGIEVLRGTIPFGGFTWGRLSFAVIDTPYAALLPWIGANGVSLVLVGSVGAVLWAVVNRRREPVLLGALTAGVVGVAVLPTLIGPQWTTERTARIAVIQGNVPGDGTDVAAYHHRVTADHAALSVQLGAAIEDGTQPRPDFVVWPENSTASDPFRNTLIAEHIDTAVSALDVPLLVGAMVDHHDPDKVLNQGVVFDPETGPGDRYTKRHPVPFGEFIPFRHLLPQDSNIGRLAEIPRDMVAGNDRAPLQIAGIRVADAICFDVSYDDVFVDQVRRGAEVIVVQTSNAMFIHTGQIDQQFAISRVRALESGRTVVVAAINGLSGVIGPDGEVTDEIAPRSAGVMNVEVALADGTPPSLYLGPWLGRLSALVTIGILVVLIVGRLSYRRQRRRAEGEQG